MKITCDKQELSSAISSVSLAVSPKSSMQSLEGILLRAKNGRLYLTGYDLELGISTSVEAKVLEEGEVVLAARLFADIVRRLPSDILTLSCNEKMLTEIKGGMAEYTLLGISASEFPELPAIAEAAAVELPQNTLASMIQQTLFAIATTDSKPVHTGSLFELEENMVTMVSVDGYRLALRRERANVGKTMSFIVPGKTLADLLKLLDDSDDPVGIQVSKKHIVFEIGDCVVVSRLLEGDFLNYKTSIPQGGSTTVTIKTREFIDSIDRTSLLISDRLRSPLRVNFGQNEIQISCSTTIGKANDQVACATQGPAVEMGFNNRYLLDALKAAGCDQVKMEINGPLSPMIILPCEGDSFLFLVLPVRLKTE